MSSKFPNRITRISYVFECYFLSHTLNNNQLKSKIINDFIENKTIIETIEEDIFESQNINDLLKFAKNTVPQTKKSVIFSKNISNICYEIENKTLKFNFDIISNIFFYLSGYQEIIIQERDSLHRFNFKNSIQNKLQTAHIPIVNILFEFLTDALNTFYKIDIQNKFANPAVWVTSDVDIWQHIKRNSILQCLKKGNLIETIKVILFQKIYYWKIKLKSYEDKYQCRSCLFFMSECRKFGQYNNADYEIKKTKFQKVLQSIDPDFVGIHPSFGCNINEKKLRNEIAGLKIETSINRFHFLQFDLSKTSQILENSSLTIDSSLGFAEEIGFRNGTSLPFYLFDFNKNMTTHVVEIPLILMDATLFYPHYLGIEKKEIFFEKIVPLITNLKTYGGIFTINFHNHIFVEPKYQFWLQCFDDLMDYLQKNNFYFIDKSIKSYLNQD